MTQTQPVTERPARQRTSPSLRYALVDLHALDPDARELLMAEVHLVHDQVTGGLSTPALRAWLMRPCERAWVATLRDWRGDLVAFGTAHAHQVMVRGHGVLVFRGGGFAAPGIHAGPAIARMGLTALVQLKARSPRRPSWLLLQNVTPAPYRLTTRYLQRVYPNRALPTPPEVEQLRDQLIEHFGFETVPGRPWVVRSLARPRADFKLRAALHPDVEHYLKLNPDFAQGEALVCLVPLDKVNAAALAWRLVKG